jgi:benzoyl-CoA reductase subunit BamC
MATKTATKLVKEIRVDITKCTGCRACEMACSAYHAKPRYSSINPARSRIRVVSSERNDEYVPIRATDYTPSECNGRRTYIIEGKEYSDCSFCGSPCPSRDLFFEPDSGLPLKCDMCESIPEIIPMCVQACGADALTYHKYDVTVDTKEQERRGGIEIGLENLVNHYGIDAILEGLKRMAK